jgi:hypothetical protein
MAGVIDGELPSRIAAEPATCGLAIDVPLAEASAVVLVYQDEVIDTPGAKMSTQLP